MSEDPRLAEIAALVGDPARANMLSALADGRVLTAGELAYAAGVSPQTASGHLAKLSEARLLVVAKQGRHRYYRMATPLVGRMIESIMAVAANAPPRYRPAGRFDAALRFARTCYDHFAGRLGVGLTDGLCAHGHVALDEDGGEVTETGVIFLSRFGLDFDELRRRRRVYCRPCLDWTERRPHLAGAVGAGLASRCFDLGWVKRKRDSRALTITERGRDGFREVFGFLVPEDERGPMATHERIAARL
ncbi:MAG TPA: helix-turn-helix transcriptional regulator [Stellaceae bacterium]|nr:helix-turn-helix transcriptional regulator [Stellaceae bacterium]